MAPVKTKKTFDCIAFKRKVQSEIYEEIRGMTAQEQIEYFNKRALSGPLGKWWRKVQKESGK